MLASCNNSLAIHVTGKELASVLRADISDSRSGRVMTLLTVYLSCNSTSKIIDENFEILVLPALVTRALQ